MRNKQLDYVSAKSFSDTLKEVKARMGLTWREMADLTGRSPGTLAAFAHGSRECVRQSTVDDILRRLSGEPLPPTARQRAEYTVKARKSQTIDRSETLLSRQLHERKSKVAELRDNLQSVRLD